MFGYARTPFFLRKNSTLKFRINLAKLAILRNHPSVILAQQKRKVNLASINFFVWLRQNQIFGGEAHFSLKKFTTFYLKGRWPNLFMLEKNLKRNYAQQQLKFLRNPAGANFPRRGNWTALAAQDLVVVKFIRKLAKLVLPP